MNVLITGNMGYIGPVLVSEIRKKMAARVTGVDSGFFAGCLLDGLLLPERYLDVQIYKDVRDVTADDLRGIDAVVCLAALSNDPMGNYYGMQTIEINYGATAKIALLAKGAGVKCFVFASSCSVYGFSESGECNEESQVNPLTEYARSKVMSERFLKGIADDSFRVTCFRFATACGASPRLRLDLVLNDFVACAITKGKIEILSDGTPWRPLIDVKDMSASLIWAMNRKGDTPFLLLNAGRNDWNFQIKNVAEIVRSVIAGTEICISPSGQPDKRSYRVNFDRFERLVGGALEPRSLETTVGEIRAVLNEASFADGDFRNSDYIRLNVLKRLETERLIDSEIRWTERFGGRGE